MILLDPYLLLIAALACFRMALMVSSEEGPGLPWGTPEQRKRGMFTRLREHIDPTGNQDNWKARGINCPWCVSFWAAPVAIMFIHYAPLIALWLAISGAAVLAHGWLTRRSR